MAKVEITKQTSDERRERRRPTMRRQARKHARVRPVVDDPMVRPSGAMQMLGLSRTTLYRMVRRKEFPAPVALTAGGAIGWPSSVIRQWIEERRRGA
jgi:predicted DNA-binding transcriptional regulator AlpA